jgi:hypothetical protein
MPLPGPETRIVELRVPSTTGVLGDALLDCADTVEVDGDQLGKVIRPADRLHRPAPGPVVQALGRSVPRTLEGYLWDEMTSASVMRATWALLFPFSLANVAHWMLPPIPEGSRISSFLGALCRSLLRVAGLMLTMLLVTQISLISLDLLAAQCLAPGSSCLSVISDGIRGLGWLRISLGVLPPVFLIAVLYWIGGKDWTRKPSAEQSSKEKREPGFADGKVIPGDNFRPARDAAVLRCLHAVVALSCVALLLLGGPFQVPNQTIDFVLWCCAAAMGALPLAAAAVLPEKARARSLSRWARRFLLLSAVAVLVYSAVRGASLSSWSTGMGLTSGGHPSGVDGMVESIGAALLAVNLLFAVVLALSALTARKLWRGLPKRLRPWLGGWAAAPVLALAGLLGGGFGAGITIAIRRAISADRLKLPESYHLITVLWGGAVAVAVVLGVLGFVAVPLRRKKRGIPEVVRLLQAEKGDEEPAAAAWARSSWERRHLHHLITAIVVALSLGVGAVLLGQFGFHHLPAWSDYLSGVGMAALGLVAIGLLRVFHTSAKGSGRARHWGAFVDLVSFWPRTAHPTIPPCYARKVAPELAARVRTHLSEPHTHVVLTGQHLGSLLSLLATGELVRTLPPEKLGRLGLVTAGSPLQWGYQRAFPAIFPISGLAELQGALSGRWRGLARGTDVFGGGVTTWRHQVINGKLLGTGFHADGKIAPLASAEPSVTGALVLGSDHWLPDPLNHTSLARRWAAGVLRQCDYVVDPEWDHAVAIAGGLERLARQGLKTGEQTALFTELPKFLRV